MSWDDISETEKQLKSALGSFDWSGVAVICQKLIEKINRGADLLPEGQARGLLKALRDKRRFNEMTLLADALIRSGHRSPQIKRQYAQALIDQGILTAAELTLQSIILNSSGDEEEIEARGLMGRVYKQAYVNMDSPANPRSRAALERSLNEYLSAYRLNPAMNLWHGVNAVALLKRACLDSLPMSGFPDPLDLATAILDTIRNDPEETKGCHDPWKMATEMEALIALRRDDEAAKIAYEYSHCREADAFELASTIRQLTEVWKLTEHLRPGSMILPVLRAALLLRLGGTVEMSPEAVKHELVAIQGLEILFGGARTKTLRWYKRGLECCSSIARVERIDGHAEGTGWVVAAKDFFPGSGDQRLLLTNTHVVDPAEYPDRLRLSKLRANFELEGKIVKISEIVWSSRVSELDATFLALDDDLSQNQPLSIDSNPVRMPTDTNQSPPRMFIIGHPGGRGLEFSLQDNHLLDCDSRVLHYRSPTEGGSSGSPVFESEGWEVVALHRAGALQKARINGQFGTYEANEGISILAIQEAVKQKPQKIS